MKIRTMNRLSLFLLTLAVGCLHAQETTSYPGGPALKRAPDMSSWKITCQPAAPAGAPPANAVSAIGSTPLPYATMTVVKTHNLRDVESTDPTGLKTVRFFSGSMESYTAPGTSTAQFLFGDDKKALGIYIDFASSDFPECSWVRPEMYTGIQTQDGQKCLVFEDKTAGKSINANDSTLPPTAYINLDTRLPIKVELRGLNYTYEFLSPPTVMLTLPPLMKARIDFETQRAKALSVHPALG
jgi:hypothetical protein